MKISLADDFSLSLTTRKLGLFLHVVTILNAVNHGYGSTWTDLSDRDRAGIEKVSHCSTMYGNILEGKLTLNKHSHCTLASSSM